MKTIVKAICVVAAFFITVVCLANECGYEAPVGNKNETIVRVENTALRKLSPQFFGFNLEIIEFQSSLWNKKDQQVEPNIIEHLRRFPGAVYRYPGGTVANHFDWKAATGPLASRSAQKIMSWQPTANIIEFGPAEYLNFVSQVNGKAWYVLNMYGGLSGAEDPSALADSASQLVLFMNDLQSKGLPSIYRWELGNELDRGQYQWSASKYAMTSQEIVAAVRRSNMDAEMVGMTQDWEHTGASVSGVNYNTTVALDLKQYASEFAGHLYYDGAPWGPSIPRVIKQLCKNFESVKMGSSNGTLWVTEHGRTPLGTPDDPTWKTRWPQTGDLGAAISVSDMMISLARTSGINGAFVHSLHGTNGPWPMFHKNRDGMLNPSAVYWALVLLREVLLDDVLNVTIATTNHGVGEGYDINAAVFSNSERSRFSLWIVNRSPKQTVATFYIPPLSGKRVIVKLAQLSGSESSASNYDTPFKVFPSRHEVLVDVDARGYFSLDIPAYSVYVSAIEVTVQ